MCTCWSTRMIVIFFLTTWMYIFWISLRWKNKFGVAKDNVSSLFSSVSVHAGGTLLGVVESQMEYCGPPGLFAGPDHHYHFCLWSGLAQEYSDPKTVVGWWRVTPLLGVFWPKLPCTKNCDIPDRKSVIRRINWLVRTLYMVFTVFWYVQYCFGIYN